MASLSIGSSGTDVRRLQYALREAGYFEDVVDGKFGPTTKAAVEAYQRENELKVDGKVGELTWSELEADGFEEPGPARPLGGGGGSDFTPAPGRSSLTRSVETVAEGAQGRAVLMLQEALRAKGYALAKLDGKFGPGTADAVRRFQEDNGLTADGKVGRLTALALGLGDAYALATQDVQQMAGVQGTQQVGGSTGSSSTHLVARFDRYPSGKGMTTGSITLAGRTYRFNSGKGKGKGVYYSTVKGEYRVARQGGYSDVRSGRPFKRNGVGFSFIIEDVRRPGSDQMWDSRAGRQRTALRIHPDGASDGTQGCLGLTGSAEELRRFRDDLNAAIRANGGSITLSVQ